MQHIFRILEAYWLILCRFHGWYLNSYQNQSQGTVEALQAAVLRNAMAFGSLARVRRGVNNKFACYVVVKFMTLNGGKSARHTAILVFYAQVYSQAGSSPAWVPWHPHCIDK